MLQALVHRLTLQAHRHVPVSFPASPLPRRAGELARAALRTALFGALAVGIVAASGLAMVYVAHAIGGTAGVLVAWLAGTALAAAAPGVAARATAALFARYE